MTRTMPQRLAHDSPPGSLFKRPDVKPRLKKQRDAIRDAKHLAAIRQLPCLKCGMEDFSEAAHVRLQSAAFNKRGGIGVKPSDCWTVPLCAACHRTDADAQHKIGELTFWARLGLNPLLVCEKLYQASPDIVSMRAVAFTFIAGRKQP